MAQKPVSGLQHPPRGQGLGRQGVPAVHWPLHWDAGVEEQIPSSVQHAPLLWQGVGLQVVFGKKGPLQVASET
jgi:hypothetical protein